MSHALSLRLLANSPSCPDPVDLLSPIAVAVVAHAAAVATVAYPVAVSSIVEQLYRLVQSNLLAYTLTHRSAYWTVATLVLAFQHSPSPPAVLFLVVSEVA